MVTETTETFYKILTEAFPDNPPKGQYIPVLDEVAFLALTRYDRNGLWGIELHIQDENYKKIRRRVIIQNGKWDIDALRQKFQELKALRISVKAKIDQRAKVNDERQMKEYTLSEKANIQRPNRLYLMEDGFRLSLSQLTEKQVLGIMEVVNEAEGKEEK